jgi:hypothetical protein
MKTSARFLALAVCLAGAALAPASVLAAGGRGFSGHSGGGWHGGSHGGAGWHGGARAGAGWRGDHWRGSHWNGRRGYVGPGVFWGGIGLGLGLGAIGYYDGWWGPYGGAPYAYDGYYYGAVPSVVVGPGVAAPVAVAPAPRSPDPIFYPVHGQSAATTESDRRDCNRWATTQSGAMADASVFQRATFACMEGRGYTVR